MKVVAVPVTIPRSGSGKLGILAEMRLAVRNARRAHPGLGALVDVTAKRLEDGVRLVLFFSAGPKAAP